ncbi:MAG: hypothetical protein K2Q26_00135 [Bdellovibrionales bacterium]|nr:hypothetical protein [Bdellovibrionales bacterium]
MVRRLFIFGVALVSIALPVSASARICTDIFLKKSDPLVYQSSTSSQVQRDFQFLVSVMKILKTDRFEIFREHQDLSVAQFLKFVAQTHQYQLQQILNYRFSNVPREFLEGYLQQITKTVKVSRSRIEYFQEHQTLDIHKVKMRALLDPRSDDFQKLSDMVVSTMVSPTTIMAEMLAAIKFGYQRSMEQHMEDIVPNWDREVESNGHLLSEADLTHLKTRRMDVLSIRPDNKIYLIEVKYLGRNKDYNKASGSDVLRKMKLLRQITQSNSNIQIILAVAGPGKLTEDMYEKYAEHGVKVVHLTPNW